MEENEIDYYRFEVSFSMAFNMIIYIIVFLYSLIAPIITLVGALYFTIKYFVDKYNLTVVYPKNYDSKGQLGKKISKYNHFSIYFIQLIMFILFTITLKRTNLYIFFIASVSFQLLLTALFQFKDHFHVMERFFARRGNYMTEQEETKLSYEQGLLDDNEMRDYDNEMREY